MSSNRQDEILDFWLGRIEETLIPTENRARIWFGEDEALDRLITEKFNHDLMLAESGQYSEWTTSPRGQLALIIILDQFSRHIYRGSPKAFAYDQQALAICLDGLNKNSDHKLSLIERVFYYFPLLHSEDIAMQELSVKSYRMLFELSLNETRVIFDSFLKFAQHHLSVVRQFGRFPQRNQVLRRHVTVEEQTFLNELQD